MCGHNPLGETIIFSIHLIKIFSERNRLLMVYYSKQLNLVVYYLLLGDYAITSLILNIQPCDVK